MQSNVWREQCRRWLAVKWCWLVNWRVVKWELHQLDDVDKLRVVIARPKEYLRPARHNLNDDATKTKKKRQDGKLWSGKIAKRRRRGLQ